MNMKFENLSTLAINDKIYISIQIYRSIMIFLQLKTCTVVYMHMNNGA